LTLQSIHIDNELITKLQDGNLEAFRLLFEKYGTRIYQFSLKYLREKEDAEDLLSEVFLKIWENRSNIKTDTSFQSYLFTIAYNNIRQRFLKRDRQEKYIQIFAYEYFSEYSQQESDFDYTRFVSDINEIIELLPTRRREIFNLRYKQELKNNEISSKLGLSEQFVKNQLSIAKKFIISKIKKDDYLGGILFLYLFTGDCRLD
jgi:RNA polymerase sigma-70 factor (ECF subfamily)